MSGNNREDPLNTKHLEEAARGLCVVCKYPTSKRSAGTSNANKQSPSLPDASNPPQSLCLSCYGGTFAFPPCLPSIPLYLAGVPLSPFEATDLGNLERKEDGA